MLENPPWWLLVILFFAAFWSTIWLVGCGAPPEPIKTKYEIECYSLERPSLEQTPIMNYTMVMGDIYDEGMVVDLFEPFECVSTVHRHLASTVICKVKR